MKLVAIMGSPRGMKGSTGELLDALLKSAEAAGAETTTFELGKLKVAPCVSCDACHKVGRCVVKDDFQQVLEALLEADGFVLASPNYIYSVSAQMKALFDRCCGPIHTQALEGKYGAAVVSSGGPGNEEVEKYMLRFANSLGAWAVGSTGTDLAHIFNPEKLPQVLKAAADLGTELVEAIGSGKTYPEQVPGLQGFREYMRSWLVTQGERWPFEAQYWKDRS